MVSPPEIKNSTGSSLTLVSHISQEDLMDQLSPPSSTTSKITHGSHNPKFNLQQIMIFSIKPSQWINTGWILLGIIGFPLVIPTLISIYMIAHVYYWSYEFHDGYIIEQKGVFTINRTEINLHRIKSVKLVQPFLYRFVGLYNIHVISSDPFKPYMTITAVPYGNVLIDAIKEETNTHRKRKGLTESDIHIL
jgi:uncharacterized membrane protein YdbT with pleckstrin-like domain